nr:hypothetical protein [uncultured Lichenicoccus sp.]
MQNSFNVKSGTILAVGLGAVLWMVPVTLRAQTLDTGVGIGPSEKLSTPPDADPINQPGAMRRAVAQQRLDAARAKQHRTTPATSGGSAPPK